MRINRRQKLFIFLLTFLLVIGGSFLFSLNRPRNFNVLLITIDSLRPDHLGCYGYKRNTSPNIDKLAKEGVLFTQAISQASWTWPSIHSLITSTYPSTHNVYFYDQILSEEISTLPKILKENGHSTGFIAGHKGSVVLRNSLGRDFDIFDSSDEDADKITEKVISRVDKNKNKKFFLWIHYMDTHNEKLGITDEKHLMENLTKREIEEYISKYDQAINFVDTQIGLLVEKLKELGVYEDTLIVVTADHGTEMGEHSAWFSHGGPLWDSLIKVPLIIFYPKLYFKNKIIIQEVQLIDIVPIICNLLKLEKPKTFEGRSLLPLMKKDKMNFSFAFSEHKQTMGDFLNSDKLLYSQFSIKTPEWKLMLTLNNEGRDYQLYNFKKDPRELINLIHIEKEQFKFLKAKLEKWMNRPKPKITPLTKPLDEETKMRLKSLGYLQ